MQAELIWTLVGFFLTLMILSYIFGDNVLFRIATYIFVGVAAGYVAIMLLYQVLIPRLALPLLAGQWLTLVPLLLSLALIFKLFPRLSYIGKLPMAYLVGVAAAVIIGGAIQGTLFGQSRAVIALFDLQSMQNASSNNRVLQLFGGAFILLGTISTLIYFSFGAVARANDAPKRAKVVEWIARVGQYFIVITLGAIFAGIFAASITALIERLDFLKTVILGFF